MRIEKMIEQTYAKSNFDFDLFELFLKMLHLQYEHLNDRIDRSLEQKI